jgi:hypothetical protein
MKLQNNTIGAMVSLQSLSAGPASTISAMSRAKKTAKACQSKVVTKKDEEQCEADCKLIGEECATDCKWSYLVGPGCTLTPACTKVKADCVSNLLSLDPTEVVSG